MEYAISVVISVAHAHHPSVLVTPAREQEHVHLHLVAHVLPNTTMITHLRIASHAITDARHA